MNARDRLIDATRELLWQRGYAATSPKAILRRSGTGQGSMYHHFAGKEELAHTAFEQSAASVRGKAQAALGSADSGPLDRLIAYLTLPREVLRGCPVGRMTGDADVLATPALAEVVESVFADLRRMTVETVRAAVATGEFPADLEPTELADTVLATVQGGYVLARAAGDADPFDRAVRGAVALLDHVRIDDRHRKRTSP